MDSNARSETPRSDHSDGLACIEAGDLDGAARCFENALRLDPCDAVAYHNLGGARLEQGRLPEAAECFRNAARHGRADPAAWNILGVAYQRQRQLDRAAECFQTAITLQPALAEAHNNLGNVLRERGRLDEAVACYRTAVGLRPDFAAALNNLGIALERLGERQAAEDTYRRALDLQPDLAEAHNNLGNLLKEQACLEDAAAHYRRALELSPRLAEAANNLARLRWEQGRHEEAAAAFRQAVRLRPDQLLWQLRLEALCPTIFDDAAQIERYRRDLTRVIERFAGRLSRVSLAELGTSGAQAPYNLQFLDGNLRPVKEAWAALFTGCFAGDPPAARGGWNGGGRTGGRGDGLRPAVPLPRVPPPACPRIGFVVTAAKEWVFLRLMGHNLARMRLDDAELWVVCPRGSLPGLQATLGSETIRYLPLPERFDQAVDTVAAAGFDVLHFWEVGTDELNYFLPFFRLAPVQCTSWGIQVTSGIPQMDYYLSSALIEPAVGETRRTDCQSVLRPPEDTASGRTDWQSVLPGTDADDHYSERLIRASTILCYQPRVPPPDRPKSREEFGVAGGDRWYVCSQHLGKFHPDFDPLLAGILREDGRGVVVLTKDRHGYGAEKLRCRFERTIPDVAERIVFLPHLRHDDYMSLLAAADVLLDPPHFGGVNTTYDGLSLNKPIVTLPSPFHRGRYTLGCYRRMGVLDCVARDADDYVRLAVGLASDADRRADVTARITEGGERLFEDDEAVREHERILRDLLVRARAG